MNLTAFSSYILLEYLNPMKAFKAVEVRKQCEFVVTDIRNLSAEDAKREMKDKKQKAEFVLPDVLPSLNFDLEAEAKGLKQTRFDEF